MTEKLFTGKLRINQPTNQLVYWFRAEKDKACIAATPVDTNFIVTGENESPTEINKSVTIKRVDLKTTHEEADNVLEHQVVAAKEDKK